MKILISHMHGAKKYLAIMLMLVCFSCEESNDIKYSDGGFLELADPYLQIKTPVVPFQAGNESYDIMVNTLNGTRDINEVRVYSTFTDAETGNESNEVLLATYSISDPVLEVISDDFTYEELKAGLTVDGNPLPASDVDLAVGSGWKLRFEGTVASGEEITLAGNIVISVLSRFAGIYKVVDSKYYRIGVLTATWTGQERFIGSIDETTFSYNDFWGPFSWTGNKFNFSVDFDNNSIFVPIPVDGVFAAGATAINCVDNPGYFTNVPCGSSNILIPDDVTGKHRIKITYGYFVEAGAVGPREFYEELEKVVD